MKINQHTSHPSAFISSTFVDLFEDRNAVAETLIARGLNVNALDIKPASEQTSKREIITGIKESDFVILIIGDRYGSTLESMTGNSTKSITWWEYDIAKRSGKPVIAYFKKYNSHDPKSHDEKSNSLYKRNRKLFEEFKNLITRNHNPSYYTDPIELSNKVNKSLISIYRAGVKTLDSKNTELNLKVSQLEAEVNTLKAELSSFNTSQKPVYNQGLSGGSLSGGSLSGAGLSGGSLSGAGLSGGSLSGAGLSDAGLSSGSLSGAGLSGAGLSDGSLSDGSLSGAGLTATHQGLGLSHLLTPKK